LPAINDLMAGNGARRFPDSGAGADAVARPTEQARPPRQSPPLPTAPPCGIL